MSETPKTGKLSVLVFQLKPPSVVFHNPPPGEPTQKISSSNGSNSIQFILPFPLFLLFERIIGTSKGPRGFQLDEDFEDLLFLIINHSSHKALLGKYHSHLL